MRITMRLVQAFVVAVLTLSVASAAFAQQWAGDMREVNNSGVSGTFTLTDNGDGSTTVAISLAGVRMGSQYQASIHDGTPEKYSATPTFLLNDVVEGTSSTVLKVSLKELQSMDRVIVVADPSGIVTYGYIRSI